MINKHITLIFLLVAIISFSPSCTESSKSKIKYLDSAKLYIENSDYEKARVELKNALQIDPKYAEAYSLMGEVEENRNEWRLALSNYLKAVELNPTLLSTQVRIGQFYLLQATQLTGSEKVNRLNQINEIVNTVLEQNPTHAGALSLKASVLAQTGKIDDSVKLLNIILESNPKTVSAITLLAKLYDKQNKIDNVQITLEKGISYLPENIGLRLLLVKSYARSNKTDLTIKAMINIIDVEPDLFEHRIRLATYYTQLRKLNLAEETLSESINVNPDDARRYLVLAEFQSIYKTIDEAINTLEIAMRIFENKPSLRFALASLYLRTGKEEKAIFILSGIKDKWKILPDGIKATNELVNIYISRDDKKTAIKLIDEILTEDPTNYNALILKSKNAILSNDFTTAETSLRTAHKNHPDSIEVPLLLTEVYLRIGKKHLAEEVLNKAVKNNPNDIKTRLAITRYYLSEKQPELANAHNEYTLLKEPSYIEALALESEIFALQNDIKSTISTLDKIKQLAPNSADGWFRMGRVYKAQGNYELAIKEFETALDKAPGSISLLAELTDLEIKQGYYKKAKIRLQNILESDPKHNVAYKFQGMIYFAEKDYKNAEHSFLQHIKYNSDDTIALTHLANIYKLKGDFPKSKIYFLKALKISPNTLELKIGLANIYELLNQYEKAIQLYEEILQVHPNNIIATNNLATILVNYKTDRNSLARARQLVKNFTTSNQPALLDTLGWVYFRTGSYKDAQAAIEAAVKLSPETPEFHYHLGMIYLQTGNRNKAKIHLHKAVEASHFPGKDDAITALNTLQ